MKYSTQNLNETMGGDIKGSMLWHGRAWLRRNVGYNELFHCEWMFGSHARRPSLTAEFGEGDSGADVCLHVCIPFLFSIYLVFCDVFRCKECQTGIAIHNSSFWFYPISYSNESSSTDPWYRKMYAWDFPWTPRWLSTEVLEHKAESEAKTVYTDRRGHKLGDSFDKMREQDAVAATVTKTYPYSYRLKKGEVQNVFAKVFVERRTWTAKWYPLWPSKKHSTSISINFVDAEGKCAEVGEGTGSWKGGTTGCGYTMNPGETPEACLLRMEKERVFGR